MRWSLCMTTYYVSRLGGSQAQIFSQGQAGSLAIGIVYPFRGVSTSVNCEGRERTFQGLPVLRFPCFLVRWLRSGIKALICPNDSFLALQQKVNTAKMLS